MGRTVPVTKKGYAELLKDLLSNQPAVYRRTEATTQELADREAKVSELELKLILPDEEFGCSADLQKGLDARVGELELTKRVLGSK